MFCPPFLLLLTLSAVPSQADWLQQLEMPESRNSNTHEQTTGPTSHFLTAARRTVTIIFLTTKGKNTQTERKIQIFRQKRVLLLSHFMFLLTNCVKQHLKQAVSKLGHIHCLPAYYALQKFTCTHDKLYSWELNFSGHVYHMLLCRPLGTALIWKQTSRNAYL